MRRCLICRIPLGNAPIKICTPCLEENKDVFVKVKQYLEEHPGASALQIAKNAGVPPKIVVAYINCGDLVPF